VDYEYEMDRLQWIASVVQAAKRRPTVGEVPLLAFTRCDLCGRDADVVRKVRQLQLLPQPETRSPVVLHIEALACDHCVDRVRAGEAAVMEVMRQGRHVLKSLSTFESTLDDAARAVEKALRRAKTEARR
jgi:urease gamma subunit